MCVRWVKVHNLVVNFYLNWYLNLKWVEIKILQIPIVYYVPSCLIVSGDKNDYLHFFLLALLIFTRNMYIWKIKIWKVFSATFSSME